MGTRLQTVLTKPVILVLTCSNVQESEDVQVENFFALTAEGSTHQYTMHPVDNNTYSNCSQGVTESLDFSLVQIIAGDVVS